MVNCYAPYSPARLLSAIPLVQVSVRAEIIGVVATSALGSTSTIAPRCSIRYLPLAVHPGWEPYMSTFVSPVFRACS